MSSQRVNGHSTQTVRVSDRELVERCRAGDKDAWRALYDRYSSTVYRFICAMGVPPAEREDACQDVFVAIYRSLKRFRGDSQLSTWIYRIAARGANRLVQRRRMRLLLQGLLASEPCPVAIPDPSERTARLHLLQDLLTRLEERKRTVLVLFEIEALPVPEIARILGCPENTVWSRLHHARADLMKMARRRLT